jgi:lipoic acid synthetase
VPPDEFAEWDRRARSIGFRDVASGPLVRSSYRAERLAGSASR